MTDITRLERFMEITDDRDPVIKAVRLLVARELARIAKIKLRAGRPRLEDTPQRIKWREYQKAYRAKGRSIDRSR